MKAIVQRTLIAALAALVLAGSGWSPSAMKAKKKDTTKKILAGLKKDAAATMDTFDTDKEFDKYIKKLTKKSEEYYKNQYGYSPVDDLSAVAGQAESAPAATKSCSKSDGDSGGGESITNVQEQGVDEGDIVKAYKDYLIILRRGRIFTVHLKDKNKQVLDPISMIDAYPKGCTLGTWYDEMLIYKNRVVVVGYSYTASATEIEQFEINEKGKLKHLSAHFLDSNDYYSSRNYASRLVDNQLIFYMPHYMFGYYYGYGEAPQVQLPRVRTWVDGKGLDKGKEVLRKTDIYRPVQTSMHPTLHTVVRCDLDSADFTCTAKAVMGPYSRTFYVSPNAIYVWVSSEYEDWFNPPKDDKDKKVEPRSFLYMITIDDGSARAVKAAGMPIDQFSFKEDSSGHLNVLVRESGFGDAMWNPEVTQGKMALLRTSLKNFSSTPTVIPVEDYTVLPEPKGYIFQNRFVGDYLLYGTGEGWYYDPNADNHVYIKKITSSNPVQKIKLSHSVDRIEVMGDHAVVVGTDGSNLEFSSLRLGSSTKLMNTHSVKNAMQGELRSHGFFYKPMSGDEGVLGLPIRRQGASWQHLVSESAEVLFLKVNGDMEFVEMGSLASKASSSVNDNCMFSCVDWYGNSRPIFYKGRILALMGYELVEGVIEDEEITEIDRTVYYTGAKAYPEPQLQPQPEPQPQTQDPVFFNPFL